MRTTIELTDAQRARLLELAARRGEKGFSRLVQEAVERYLDEAATQGERIQAAQSVLGSLGEAETLMLEDAFRTSRESWR